MEKRGIGFIYYIKPEDGKLASFLGSHISEFTAEIIENSEVEHLELLPSRGELRIFLRLPRSISRTELKSLKAFFAEKMPDNLEPFFKIKYQRITPQEYFSLHFDDVMEDLRRRFTTLRSLTALVRYEFVADDRVHIYLINDFAVREAKKRNLAGLLQQKVKKYTGQEISVEVKVGDFSGEVHRLANEIIEQEKNIIEEIRKTELEQEALLYGRIGNYKKWRIADLKEENVKVCIEGECIAYTVKGNGLSQYNEMLLYDGSTSIFVKFFTDKQRQLKQDIEEKVSYIVFGRTTRDTRTGELMVEASGIMLNIEKEEKKFECEPRAELHLHSKFSALDSLVDLDELIEVAVEHNVKAVAITDHGVVHAFPEFYKIARKKGIKPILGVELYVVNSPSDKSAYHMTALVKNATGLKNLYRIVSEAHLNYYYRVPRIPRSFLMEHREGLLLGSACAKGKIYSAILNGESEETLEQYAKDYDYLEIMPVDNNDFLIRSGKYTREQIQAINKRIYELGKKLGIPVVATGDVHYLSKEDFIVHNILKTGSGFTDVTRIPNLYFRTTPELIEEFSYLGIQGAREVVIENTLAIADQIENVRPIPEGFYPPIIEDAEQKLLERVWSRAKELYGDPLPSKVKERLDYELNAITTHKFSVLYYMAMQLVDYARSNGGIVGSRGSVGSSLVATMAGITEVNPLEPHYLCPKCKYVEFSDAAPTGADLPDRACPRCGEMLKKDGFNIPFEVFLGFKGDKVPDIDLNFSERFQLRVHKYTEELYGKENVFRAGTYSTLQEKNAIGYIKKYSEETGEPITRAEMIRLARDIIGVKKTTGQHPGGLIVLPRNKEIYDFCPVQYPANKKETGVIITHFEYHSMEEQLVKLDILGQDSPTMLEMLREFTGLNPEDIPLNDEKTLELFRSIAPLGLKPQDLGTDLGVIGVPEFGTDFVQGILQKVRPKSFDELVRICGLAHGTNVWQNNAEVLIRSKKARSLEDVICARDDVMLYLIQRGVDKLSAFKIMETVRKKNKFLSDEQKEIMRKHNVPEYIIESCDKIEYLFPKAHAVAYTIMSFRIAYFKLYYPKEYYSAYFTIKRDDFDIDVALGGLEAVNREIKRLTGQPAHSLSPKDRSKLALLPALKEMFLRGFTFDKVDIYNSEPFMFKPISDTQIKPPLAVVPQLGAKVAEKIALERRKRGFRSWEDLRVRTKLTKTTIQTLARLGALDEIPENEQTVLF